METQISIQDDFDLEKITSCGQCFRVRKFDDGTYRFITGSHILYIRHIEDSLYLVSCSEKEWQEIWETYFDLTRNYAGLRKIVGGKNGFIQKTMEYGQGLRVLRQEPWEMLVTFIISQRKNIPAISKSVGMLAQKYGTLASTSHETVNPFPAFGEDAGIMQQYAFYYEKNFWH